jgi:peroxiredoxin
MKKISTPKLLLVVILVAAAAATLQFFYNSFAANAGSQNQELDRLFANMGVLKIPHRTQPVEIQLKDIYGNTFRLSDFRGKIVFLNFWATWCPSCVVEMPSMEKLHRRFKDKDFMMVAINMQESDEQVKTFFTKMKLSFTALLDSDGEVASGFAVNALPTTFVLDKEGRIAGQALGAREWDSRASIGLFEFLMNKRSDAS